jgi:hypothetical protein
LAGILTHEWKGNVRELCKVLRAGIVRRQHGLVDLTDLRELAPSGWTGAPSGISATSNRTAEPGCMTSTAQAPLSAPSGRLPRKQIETFLAPFVRLWPGTASGELENWRHTVNSVLDRMGEQRGNGGAAGAWVSLVRDWLVVNGVTEGLGANKLGPEENAAFAKAIVEREVAPATKPGCFRFAVAAAELLGAGRKARSLVSTFVKPEWPDSPTPRSSTAALIKLEGAS